MEITQETDYAVRCVLYLSETGSDRPVMIETIAAEMCIPRSFLAKILQKLAKAKIVRSFRGARGGFQLACKPKDISLLKVVEAIEGPVAMNRCTVEPRRCGFSRTCTVHPVWKSLRKVVSDYLAATDFEMIMKPRK